MSANRREVFVRYSEAREKADQLIRFGVNLPGTIRIHHIVVPQVAPPENLRWILTYSIAHNDIHRST
jgi:hypothetical protein